MMIYIVISFYDLWLLFAERLKNATTYLGATDGDEEGVFVWISDNSKVSDSYSNWVPDSPNGGDQENCMVIMGDAGNWDDVRCTPEGETTMNFVCSKPNGMNGRKKAFKNGSFRIVILVICPEHWQTYNGYCYHYSYDDDVDFTTSQTKCQEGHANANLATIFSSEENRYLEYRMRYGEASDAFIGLKKKDQTENDWEWIDGQQLEYLNWVEGEPDVVEGQNCGGMNKDGGTWFSAACADAKTYQCKLKPGMKGLVLYSVKSLKCCISASDYYRGCQPGWEKWNGNCYMAQVEMQSWEDADRSCGSRGGDLVSINSLEENSFVDTLIHEGPSCPDDGTGAWTLDSVDNMCYLYVAEGTPATEAEQRCYDAGGQLVITNTERKNHFVADNSEAILKHITNASSTTLFNVAVNGRYWFTAWIGAFKNGSDFYWLDGSQLGSSGYDNWGDNQPDNNNGNESCVDMIGDSNFNAVFGSWNDQDCSQSLPYICEKPANRKDCMKCIC
jgi:hypothetical protein